MPRNKPLPRILVLAALISIAPAVAAAGDAQFDAIVQRIKSHYHKGPIPMMGLASFVANRVHPAGLRKVKIAVFEGLDPSLSPPDKDFDAFVQQVAGPAFHSLVRVISRRDGERTFVYARLVDEDYEMLIVTLETDEATVVKTRISPDTMSRWVEKPDEMAEKSAAHPPEVPEP